MNRRWIVALVIVVCVGGLVLWRRSRSQPAQGKELSATQAAPAARTDTPSSSSSTRGIDGRTAYARRAADRRERDALRARIARAEAQSPRDARTAVPADRTDDRRRPGMLVDRVGGRDELVAHLNADFMPLARECIELAHQDAPQLQGMLALSVEVIADPQLGAVIDRADAAPRNEVDHTGLLECIRETALTVVFPPAAARGREAFELTLRVRPVGDAGSD